MIDQERIHNQCLSEDPEERIKALEQLRLNFSLLPDKEKAGNDLHKLTMDENSNVRRFAAFELGELFHCVPDKQTAWEDLHRLTNDIDSNVRSGAAFALSSSFAYLPYKEKARNDLHKLTTDEDHHVRWLATFALSSAFAYLPYKENLWNDLHRLTNDKDSDVRGIAAKSLRSAFFYVPDKRNVWNDLHRLTTDKDSGVRRIAAKSLCFAFPHVVNKEDVWNDLHRLTNDDSSDVRFDAAVALGSSFSDILDKDTALKDIHKLTNDDSSDVRFGAAIALGSAYSNIPDKKMALEDLYRLTNDKDWLVRSDTYHSLGKISIFKASKAESEHIYRKELERAIEFFESSSKESPSSNSSRFCLPFYRSFYTIIFKKQQAKEEMDKYLKEAKSAIEGSKSKELLFEAVKNLAEALKEVQNLGNLDLEAKKGELNFYRKYCDRAAELMTKTEESAPFATIAMRKGLPILDRNLKELLEEIQKKAKIACKEAKGTATEEIACAISREIQKWEIGSQEEMAFNVENLIFTLESSAPRIPENQYIFNRIQQVREQKDVAKQYGIISTIIPLIPKLYMEQTVGELKNDIKEIKEKVNYVIISLKPGIKEEVEISVETEILGTGVTHKITIPLQEISYSELKEDLEKITGMKIDKLSKLPKKLANKVKGYLLLHDKDDILDKLT